MEDKTLNQRESKVLDYIQAKADEMKQKADKDSIENNPTVKLNKLNDECKKAPSVCIDTILGKIYKDALPFDDPHRNCSIDDARDEMHQFMGKHFHGHNSEYYVKEAIRKNNSKVLGNILEFAQQCTKNFYAEKAKDIGKISIKDLNFNMALDNDDTQKLTKKLNLDEISEIIQNNVQKALQDESDKAHREDEYNKKIEERLVKAPDVIDEPSMEKALDKMNMLRRPTIYQPSLFEGIMLGQANHVTESSQTNIITEAIREYTKLNVLKALKLESFSVNSIKKLANDYAAN